MLYRRKDFPGSTRYGKVAGVVQARSFTTPTSLNLAARPNQPDDAFLAGRTKASDKIAVRSFPHLTGDVREFACLSLAPSAAGSPPLPVPSRTSVDEWW